MGDKGLKPVHVSTLCADTIRSPANSKLQLEPCRVRVARMPAPSALPNSIFVRDPEAPQGTFREPQKPLANSEVVSDSEEEQIARLADLIINLYFDYGESRSLHPGVLPKASERGHLARHPNETA